MLVGEFDEAVEAHEGEGEETGRDERHGDAAEAAGRVRPRELLAESGEDDEREAEAECGREGKKDGFEEGRPVLAVQGGTKRFIAMSMNCTSDAITRMNASVWM